MKNTLKYYAFHWTVFFILIIAACTDVQAKTIPDTFTCYTVDDLRAPVLVHTKDKYNLKAGEPVTIDYGYPTLQDGYIQEINQTVSNMYMYIEDEKNGYIMKCARSYE